MISNLPLWTFHIYEATIPAAPVYGICISQLIQNSRACGSYQHFLDRELLLTRKLLDRGIKWSHHFESCTMASMTWLKVTEHLVYRLTFFICMINWLLASDRTAIDVIFKGSLSIHCTNTVASSFSSRPLPALICPFFQLTQSCLYSFGFKILS